MEKPLQLKLSWTENQEDPEDLVLSEMTSDTDGQKAIDELNGAEYDQKTISVSIARPREERPRNNGYNSRRY